MKTDNQEFHNILTKTDFADISHFWKVPYKDILAEAKSMPYSYWRKPFDADYKREGLNDLESNVYYPGSKGDLIPAKGWRSVTVLNETGDHRDQISRFTPVFNTQNEFLQDFIEKPMYEYQINAGVYALKPELLNRIPNNYFHTTDLIEMLVKEKEYPAIFPIHENWIDIGSPVDFNSAQTRIC